MKSLRGAKGMEWLKDLVEILSTIRRNLSIFLGVVVFLCGASVINFCMAERVAVNFLSSDFIAFIPLFFAIIVFLVLLVGANVVFICTLILEGAAKSRGGQLLAVPIVPVKGAFYVNPFKKIVRVAAFQWIFLLWLPGIFTFVFLSLMRLLGASSTIYYVSILISALISILVLPVASRNIRRPCRHRSRVPPLSSSLLASSSQFIVMVLTIAVAENVAEKSSYESLKVFFCVASMTLCVALVQYLVALVIVRSSHYGRARQAFWGGLLVVSVFCIFPFTSSAMVRLVLSAGSVGVFGCVRLGFEPRSDLPSSLIDKSLEYDAPLVWTKEIARAIPYGAVLQMKLEGDGDVIYRIRQDDLREVMSCSKARLINKQIND